MGVPRRGGCTLPKISGLSLTQNTDNQMNKYHPTGY